MVYGFTYKLHKLKLRVLQSEGPPNTGKKNHSRHNKILSLELGENNG
jgi:hypothetical protein